MKYRILFILIFLTCLQTHANDLPFDRLFTSSSERAELHSTAAPIAKEKPLVVANNKPSERLHLSGFMVNANGQSQVWVNGQRVDNTTSTLGIQSAIPNLASGQVLIRYQDLEQLLSPGQTWVLDSNTVINSSLDKILESP